MIWCTHDWHNPTLSCGDQVKRDQTCPSCYERLDKKTTLASMPLWATTCRLEVCQLDVQPPAEPIRFAGRMICIGDGGIIFCNVQMPLSVKEDGSFERDIEGEVIMVKGDYRILLDELHHWEVIKVYYQGWKAPERRE